MTSRFKPTLMASMLALSAITAFAQMPPAPAGMMAGHGHGEGMSEGMPHGDPTRMQARMDRHLNELKARLKLNPGQEAAWTTFVTAHRMPADRMAMRPDRAAMEKLSTPERLDRMKALRQQHMAAMDQRDEATRAFYASLTPEQQKLFDAHAMPRPERAGHMAPDQRPAPKP